MAQFWLFSLHSVILLLSCHECSGEALDVSRKNDLSLLLKLLEAEKVSKSISNDVGNSIEDAWKKTEETNSNEPTDLPECAANEQLCTDGYTCIKKDWECDGSGDCPDKSDEIDCFECSHDPHGRLLAADRVCNGVADCESGEDERGCKFPCEYREFQCEKSNISSACIPNDWKCDYNVDCDNFADESAELCGPLSERCKPNTFVCRHELFCLPKGWVCDGADDCGDNSDEEKCDETNLAELEMENRIVPDSNFSWGDWSKWSECSSLCDGEQVRTRRCNVRKCQGLSSERRSCGKKYPCMHEPGAGCGTRTYDFPLGRILGGINATHNEWPWQAQLFRPGRTIPFCGGSLIRRNWVLTAAHCFDKKRYSAYKYSIALGRQHTSKRITDAKAVFVRAKRLLIHESYQVWSHKHDIAVMELEKDVPTASGIKVVCLPTSDYDWLKHTPGNEPDCYVTGFGVNEIGKRPVVLQEARVPLIDHETCSAPYVYGGKVTTSMICGGHLEGGIDACQGDSGGPLVCQNPADGRWIQVGLTSWGKGCGLPNRPGVYTKISRYLSWINDKIGSG